MLQVASSLFVRIIRVCLGMRPRAHPFLKLVVQRHESADIAGAGDGALRGYRGRLLWHVVRLRL